LKILKERSLSFLPNSSLLTLRKSNPSPSLAYRQAGFTKGRNYPLFGKEGQGEKRKVVLDMELARIYGVTTKVFNQAVKRNRRRFPPDVMFRLTAEEYENLRSQIVTSKCGLNRSQSVTGSQKRRNLRCVPYTDTNADTMN
jgi:hypothetical protein